MPAHLRLIEGGVVLGSRRPRLLVVSDVITATQFISFLQPLQSMIEAHKIDLHLVDCPKTVAEAESAFAAANPDYLVLSRATYEISGTFVTLARRRGIPYIYHIDDDLLKVPKSLGADKFTAYNEPVRIERLRQLMRSADVIYASTEALKSELQEFEADTTLWCGDIYCAVSRWPLLEPMPSPWPVIGYMGTSGHLNDLLMVTPSIERLLDENSFLRFELFGTIKAPPQLARFGNRISAHSPDMNYVGFVNKLCTLGWWVGLAPIEDNPFNRCKADTKWVEYSTAGIAVVASDVPVYHRACADGAGILAEEPEDWYGAMKSLLADADLRLDTIARARQRLAQSYSPATLQRQVLDVLTMADDIVARRRALGA